jgi:hypothetical protein
VFNLGTALIGVGVVIALAVVIGLLILRAIMIEVSR